MRIGKGSSLAAECGSGEGRGWSGTQEQGMQIICATKQATSQLLLLLMAAGYMPMQVHGSPPEELESPPFTISLPQPLAAALRTQIEQLPSTQIID
jgi:hypothetical protein